MARNRLRPHASQPPIAKGHRHLQPKNLRGRNRRSDAPARFACTRFACESASGEPGRFFWRPCDRPRRPTPIYSANKSVISNSRHVQESLGEIAFGRVVLLWGVLLGSLVEVFCER